MDGICVESCTSPSQKRKSKSRKGIHCGLSGKKKKDMKKQKFHLILKEQFMQRDELKDFQVFNRFYVNFVLWDSSNACLILQFSDLILLQVNGLMRRMAGQLFIQIVNNILLMATVSCQQFPIILLMYLNIYILIY